jgi:hypothetical protein
MSEIYLKLEEWCGTSTFLLAGLDFAVGFVAALAVAQLCAAIYALWRGGDRKSWLKWHLPLLFACATWGNFSMLLLATKPADLISGVDLLRVLVGGPLFTSPFSTLIGIPTFLVFAIKKPAVHPMIIYLVAATISVVSCDYLVWLYDAFRNSS